MGYVIITNNPMVSNYFTSHPHPKIQVKLQSSPAMEVLVAARATIRQGAALISNPLAGVRMRRAEPTPEAFNPYVSMVVTAPGGAVDFQSIKRIDEAIAIYRKNARLRFLPHSDEAVMKFQEVDMSLLVSTLASLN